jgi:hypothetical protein
VSAELREFIEQAHAVGCQGDLTRHRDVPPPTSPTSKRWVAQRAHSYDKPVKAKNAETLQLLRNAYRVLLTRGMQETHVCCLDRETREHLQQALSGV